MKFDPHSIAAEVIEIPRLAKPTPEVFEREFADQRRPVVITGSMASWPCLTRWTNSYFETAAGHRVVNLSEAQEGAHFDRDHTGRPHSMPIAEYFERIASGEISDGKFYAGYVSIRRDVPELWDDIRFPKYFDPKDSFPPNLWIGPGGNVVPLHYDYMNNFLAQVRGRKTILLYAPEDTKYLYPYPFYHRSFNFSETNIARPDLGRFPAMKKARCHIVHLEPGEMLFIPYYWWHGVFGYELNVSLNFWWRQKPQLHVEHSRQILGIQTQKIKTFMHNSRVRMQQFQNRAWRS